MTRVENLPPRTLHLYLGLLLWALVIPSAVDAQDLEVCSDAALDIVGSVVAPLATQNSSIDVDDSLVIGDVEISLDLTTSFVGDFSDISVISPFGTRVQLHAGGGGATEDFDVVYGDAGDPNTGADGLYNCAGCEILPLDPAGMSRFHGELTDGAWELEIVTFATGTLNSWCVAIDTGCAAAPPADVTCVESGLDIDVEWTNPETYDELRVVRNGETLAILAGDATTYTDVGVPPGVHDYRVLGNDGTCESGSAICSAIRSECLGLAAPTTVTCTALDDDVEISWIIGGLDYDGQQVLRDGFVVAELGGAAESYLDVAPPPGRHTYRVVAVRGTDSCLAGSEECEIALGETEYCDAPDELIPADDGDQLGAPYVVTMTIDDAGMDTSIGEVEVDLDVTTDWQGDFDFVLESPSGIRVQLHNNRGTDVDDFLVTYSDHGELQTDDTDFACDCLVQPSGPGRLSDFSGELVDGDWTLDVFTFSDGTLNNWCLDVFSAVEATAVAFERGDADGNGSVFGLLDALYLLEWVFTSGPAPPCLAAADVDANGSVFALLDALYLLDWSFNGGPAPSAPSPGECGPPAVGEGEECAVSTCTP